MNDFRTIIYNWVRENFGESEANDPSWSIEALADYLSNSDINPDELNAYTKHCVYNNLDQHYVEEDVEYFAEQRNIKLTPEQIGHIASEIRDSDWYCNINAEDMDWYINRELAIAKEKENDHE